MERFALLGAGALAACHLGLLPHRLSALREIRLFDLRQERASALARTGRPARASVVVAGSAEGAIRSAELIVAVTTATSGYIAYGWLKPGALLVNVSLDDPLPEVVLQAGKVFVDDWRLVAADGRRLLGRMLREGSIRGPNAPGSSTGRRPRRIDGELGEVLIGARKGRSRSDEVILMNPFGLAIEDLAVARRVYERALEMRLGALIDR